MEQKITVKASPLTVWETWKRSHASNGQKDLEEGTVQREIGKKKVTYRIIDVKPFVGFSILWKSFFVKLLFTHRVESKGRGAELIYGFQIRGPFAWIVRLALAKKIEAHLAQTLKAFAQQFEGRSS